MATKTWQVNTLQRELADGYVNKVIYRVNGEDGTELTRTFHRKVLTPGTLDASDNLVDTDISGEDADVQAIANAAWTTQVKAEYKAFLIANKPS